MSLGPYGYQQAYQQEILRREMEMREIEMRKMERWQRSHYQTPIDQDIQKQIDKPAQQTPDKRLLLLEV